MCITVCKTSENLFLRTGLFKELCIDLADEGLVFKNQLLIHIYIGHILDSTL